MNKFSRMTRDGIFVRKDRPGFYASWIDGQGRRKKKKLSVHTLTQARAILAAEKAKVEKALVLGYSEPGKETFNDIESRYLSYQRVRLTPAAYERTRGIVTAHLNRAFGSMRLSDVRRSHVQGFISSRMCTVSAGTVVRELNVLKHLLGVAVEWEIIPSNPASGVKPPRVAPGRLRYLQPVEIREVLQKCPSWLQAVVGLAISTGMRRSEILNLRWLDVDRNGERILLPQTKNGDSRIIYLNQISLAVFDSIKPGRGTDLVFAGLSPAQVSQAFLRACRAANIQDFRFHDLRHTAASWLRMRGADIHTVALMLGHKDLRMAARYQHLSPTFLQEASRRLDGLY